MKAIGLLFFIGIILLSTREEALAQRRRAPQGPDRPRRERLEQYRKMRLVEVLKLNEADAVRFFSKQAGHEDVIRDLMRARNEALDEMEERIRANEDTRTSLQIVDTILDIDRKIFDERQRYFAELRQFLAPEQYVKLILFERNFGRQVRDALEEIHQERRDR